MQDNVCALILFPFSSNHLFPTASISDASMASVPPAPRLSTIPAPLSTGPTSVLPESFKTEYHPKSGLRTVVESFSTFSRDATTPKPLVDDQPWLPFATRTDFEFAELIHQAALSKEQVNRLLQIIQKVVGGKSTLSFKSHDDLKEAWARAHKQMTPVSFFSQPPSYYCVHTT
jgi:hypothetical protein